jgi:Ca2+ transporting ATPase
VKGADFVTLEELATISIMCNDSALDFNDFKNIFEKVGEATEAALITLGEKINPYSVSKSGGRLESAKSVRKDLESKWQKDYTLEFSRDRKSMSSYCTPK